MQNNYKETQVTTDTKQQQRHKTTKKRYKTATKKA